MAKWTVVRKTINGRKIGTIWCLYYHAKRRKYLVAELVSNCRVSVRCKINKQFWPNEFDVSPFRRYVVEKK